MKKNEDLILCFQKFINETTNLYFTKDYADSTE